MDHVGTTRPLTTLSPIRPDRMRDLTNRLRIVRYTPGLGRPLLQLGFIHYARWLVVDSLPPPVGNGGRIGLRWKYLLFESNYDGREQDYLRTFADVLPARIAKLWGACFGFEIYAQRGHGANLAPSGFLAFVERNRLEVVDFYAAYPSATAIDVRQAIRLKHLVAEALDESGEDSAIRRIAQAGPIALGPVSAPLTLRERLQELYNPWKSAMVGRYGVNPLTVVTPLAHADERALRRLCKQASPLRGLADTETHFARLAIIPRRLMDLGQPDPDILETSYLLFTSDAWGQSYDQIEAIRTRLGGIADQLWGGCDGYDGHRDRARFHAWVNGHSLPTRYYVAGYPPRTVSEIKLSLKERAQVADSYVAEPHPPASRLLAALDTADRD